MGIDLGAAGAAGRRRAAGRPTAVGFEGLAGSARRRRRSQEAHGHLAVRSRRSSTISASSTTGRSPSSVTTPRTTIGEEVGLPGRVDGWVAKAKELPSRVSAQRNPRVMPVAGLPRDARRIKPCRNAAAAMRGCGNAKDIDDGEITAAMVKELREHDRRRHDGLQGGADETSGDMEAAIDWLRKKGLSKAAKKAGRVAAEGLIGIVVAGTKGVVVEVNSETDFVARNDQFQGLVKMIAQVALDVGDRCRDDQGRQGRRAPPIEVRSPTPSPRSART